MKDPLLDRCCVVCGVELTDSPHYCQPRKPRKKRRRKHESAEDFVRRCMDGVLIQDLLRRD